MLNKLLYERMCDMYDSELNRIYNKLDSKTGEIMSGDMTPDIALELQSVLTQLGEITKKLVQMNMPDTYERVFYCIESQELVSESELREIWDNDPDLREEHENKFFYYLRCCQSHNGGTLIELDI